MEEDAKAVATHAWQLSGRLWSADVPLNRQSRLPAIASTSPQQTQQHPAHPALAALELPRQHTIIKACSNGKKTNPATRRTLLWRPSNCRASRFPSQRSSSGTTPRRKNSHTRHMGAHTPTPGPLPTGPVLNLRSSSSGGGTQVILQQALISTKHAQIKHASLAALHQEDGCLAHKSAMLEAFALVLKPNITRPPPTTQRSATQTRRMRPTCSR